MVSISRAAPAASRISRVAFMISGPMPSPWATVIGVFLAIIGIHRILECAKPRNRTILVLRLSQFFIDVFERLIAAVFFQVVLQPPQRHSHHIPMMQARAEVLLQAQPD